MSTIATPNYLKQAADQVLPQKTSTTQNNSLTSKAAEQTLDAINKSYQNPTTSMSSISAVKNGTSNAMIQPQVAATQSVPTTNGMKGVRATLNNYGINDVGWNDATKSVTINGKDYYKPSTVVDGTSYANDRDMYNIINSAYRDKGKSIAGATDYVNSKGISNAVKWSGGQLMVGGQNVPVAYVDDNGTAYAEKSALDKAIASYEKNAGIKGNQGVYDSWKSEYGDRINDALDTILNRKEWSYDPESDSAYQAYKEAYTREGNKAYQNAYAQMAANTGGYGSSVGMTAAGQQMNNYMQQLGDRIPELMQNSYSRYANEQELNRAALNSLLGVADSDYNKAYQANRDSISDTSAANYYNYLRDKDARDYNRQVGTEDRTWKYQEPILQNQVEQSNADTSRYAQNADLDLESKQLSNTSQRITNQMAKIQEVLSKYQYSGNIDAPIAEEDALAMGIGKKADGTYPSIRDIQEQYATLQAAAQLIGWNNYGKAETLDTWKINNGLYGM